MSYAFSPKIRPWPARAEGAGNLERGAISLVVLFLLFVFSGLGLSMIYLSGVHIKINASRRFSLFLGYASENGVKRGLADVGDWLQSAGPFAAVSEGRVEDFREDPEPVFPLLLEEALGAGFPRLVRESSGGLNWESLSTCGLQSAEDRGTYFRITAGLRVESTGALDRLRPTRVSSLEGSLGILAGNLPLPAIPFLINKAMTEAERSRFVEESGVSLVSTDGNLLAPQPAVTAEPVIPGDAGLLVGRALNLRIFRPQDLTPLRLRAALGLEPSEEPVPDGVYLVPTDIGLGGVFVQGDIEEMVTAIDGDSQVVVFRLEAGEWTLKWSPSRSRTEFLSPEAVFSYDRTPLGIIIVNGCILSLGGGVVDPDGSVFMVTDREVPSILSGVRLTIVSSEKVTLSSHLILQGVRWQDGIPYIKESQSQVVIFSTGRDFLSQADLEGGIEVAASAPDELKLQASLTAGRGGFEIGGAGKTVEVLGALHATDYAGNGNSLRLVPDERLRAGELSENAPVTASPRLSVYSLKVLNWSER